MSQVDLHIHSTASDGRLSPAEVVLISAKAGLSVIALTDHDTIAGIPAALEAAKSFPGLKVIPGVEISTYLPEGEVHLLGYFIDFTNHELLTTLESMRHSRQERAQQIIRKLRELGLPIEAERVREIAGSGSVGRPHIAQAMLEKGYIISIKEAFTKYLAWGGPAYVEREKISPEEAVALVLGSNGLPVLAHPLTINDPETMIIRLKSAGLVGIEAYYDGNIEKETSRLLSLAKSYNLIATGGSDYHGLDDSAETMIGGADVPIEAAEGLMALAKQPSSRLNSP